MVEDLMRDFLVGAAVLGNISAIYFYAYAAMQIPIGVALDRWGARRALVAAALACAVGTWLFGVADDLWTAYLGRLMIGAGAGVTWIGTLKLVSDWFPRQKFAMMTGLTMMLGTAGAVIGQAPLAAVFPVAGRDGTMTAAAIFVLVVGVLVLVVVRARPGPASAAAPKNLGLGVLAGLRTVIRRPQCWIAAVFGGTMAASFQSFGGLWGVPYLMQAYGLERPAAAFSTSLMLIGLGIGAPLAGWLSDRIGRRRRPAIIGAIVTLASFAALVYLPGLSVSAARGLLLLNGIAVGASTICFAIGRENNRVDAAGATLGFVNMGMVLGGALFQPLIGWILDLVWDGRMVAGARIYSVKAYQTAFLSLIACGVIALISAYLVRETYCRPVDYSD